MPNKAHHLTTVQLRFLKEVEQYCWSRFIVIQQRKSMDILKQVIPKPFKLLIKKWADLILFELKLRRATPIFVYQMGKVGSSSVYRSLLKQYAGVVLHAHSFSPNHKNSHIRRLYQWAILKSQSLNVISLTSEPIDRNVSAFFQNFERDTGVPYANSSFSFKELNTIFLSNYMSDIPLEWFDKNILANFGIDVFATQFPENGTSTHSHKNTKLLVIRSEISDDDKGKAIVDFLGLTSFKLHRTNIGEEKDYSKTYKNFKDKVLLPSDYVARMCDSRYFNHFYSKEVIEATRKKWSES